MSSRRDSYHDGRYIHQRPNGPEAYPTRPGGYSGTNPQYALVSGAASQVPRYDPYPPAPDPVYSSDTPSPSRYRQQDLWQSRSLEPQSQSDDVAIVRPQVHMPPHNPVPPRPSSHHSSLTMHPGPDYAIPDSPPRRHSPQPRNIPVGAYPSTDGRSFSVVAVGRLPRRRTATALDERVLRDTSAGPKRKASGGAQFTNELHQEPDNDEDEDNDVDDYALRGSIYSDSGRSEYFPSVPSRDHGDATPKQRSAFDLNDTRWPPFS